MALRWLLAATTALGAPGAAFAHHSASAFDMTQEIVVEGTISEVAWRNPHIGLTLEVTGPDGATALQEIEVGPISTLQPLGLTEESLAPGTPVSVRASPNRRGPGHTVIGLDMTLPDGEIYPLHVRGRAREPSFIEPAQTLAGQWVPPPQNFVQMIREAPSWPVTDAGRALAADVESLRASEGSCVSFPAPMLTLVSAMRTLTIQDDHVTIAFDWMGVERVVHLDETEHPADVGPTLHGHSIGRWEGETLVIDTARFAPHPQGAGYRTPSTEQKHTVERLTLAADGLSLDYAITVEDPIVLQEPITLTTTWRHRPDLRPSDVECDPAIAAQVLDN